MLQLVTCVVLLCATTCVAQGTLARLPEGLTVHKRSVKWDEAHAHCQREGGVIASPINGKALNAMKSVIGEHNITYYIGTKATDSTGEFVSTEGVALEDMPLAVTLDMIQQLNAQEGDCLAMSRDSIRAVPCWSELPYMCYSTHEFNINKTYCGPVDEGYQYDASTGNCYKLHKRERTWPNAHLKCISERANLAVVANEMEAQSIKSMYDFVGHDHIIIGRHKILDKPGWMTIYVEELYNVVTGTRSATDDDFQCGGLHRSGAWNYIRCYINCRFVCQKQPTTFNG